MDLVIDFFFFLIAVKMKDKECYRDSSALSFDAICIDIKGALGSIEGMRKIMIMIMQRNAMAIPLYMMLLG